MKTKTKNKSVRAWLNPQNHSDTGASAISSTITENKIKLNDSNQLDTNSNYLPSLDLQWQIWDCSRKVSIDLSVYGDPIGKNGVKYTKREMANRRKKIELLKAHVQFIEDQFNEYEADVNQYIEETQQYEQVTSKRVRKRFVQEEIDRLCE